jgi:hypothetical protein
MTVHARRERIMENLDVQSAVIYGVVGLVALAGFSIYISRLLARTWFNPTWMAARDERRLNDPLYEGNWETWA